MISTPEYKLANFFDSIIKSYLPDNHMLYSTEDFLEKLNQFKFNADHKLVSFDVQSLFTNVLAMKLLKLQRTSFIQMTIAQNTNSYQLKRKFLSNFYGWLIKECSYTKISYFNSCTTASVSGFP